MRNIQVTDYCRHIMTLQVKEGDICVDATVGNGHDTVHLAELAGDSGKVIGFDIQDLAIKNTMVRLEEAGLNNRVELHKDSHENMKVYIEENSVSIAVFNFGYLPGGEHSISTKADSSIRAIEAALDIIKKEGVVVLCVYSGGESGFAERDAILEMVKSLDPKKYLVMKTEYYNRANNPPMPIVIIKL